MPFARDICKNEALSNVIPSFGDVAIDIRCLPTLLKRRGGSSLNNTFGDKYEWLFPSLHYYTDAMVIFSLAVLVKTGLAFGTIRLVDQSVRNT